MLGVIAAGVDDSDKGSDDSEGFTAGFAPEVAFCRGGGAGRGGISKPWR